MIAFIKNYKLEMIKRKFILLYLLNVTDIIFTVLLLQTGYFAEVNLLMIKAVQSPAASIILKVLLPAVLLYCIYKRMKACDDLQLKAANIAVNISLSIYTLVNLSHLVWLALLPVFIMKYPPA
jgi:hypothetical protein